MKQISPLAQFFIDNGFPGQNDNGHIRFPLYTDETNELAFLNSGAGVRDISASPIFRLTGADALDFLHRISTNDVKSMAPLEVKKTIFANEKGRILDEIILFTGESGIFIIGHEDNHELLEFWLNRFIIADDVKIENLYGKYGALEIIGPRSTQLLQKYFGDVALSAQEGKVYPCSIGNFSYKVLCLGNARNTKDYVVISPVDPLKILLSDLIKATQITDVGMAGDKAYERYRIAAGIPSLSEMNDNYNPHEAKMLHSVCFTKGCYIGQEVIARLATYNKIQRYLCNLVFDGKLMNGHLPELFNEEGKFAGKVTSQAFFPDLNQTVAMGYIEKNSSHAGQKLTTEVDGRSYEVTVKELGNLS